MEKLIAKPIEGGLGLLDSKETYRLNFCKTLVKFFDSPLSKVKIGKKENLSIIISDNQNNPSRTFLYKNIPLDKNFKKPKSAKIHIRPIIRPNYSK